MAFDEGAVFGLAHWVASAMAPHRLELPHLRDGELHPIPSVWGHRAGNPVSQPEDRAFIEGHVRALLAR